MNRWTGRGMLAMPRNLSFSMTTDQFRRKEKTVTRIEFEYVESEES